MRRRLRRSLATWVVVSFLLHLALAGWLRERRLTASADTPSPEAATVRIAWVAAEPQPEAEESPMPPIEPSEAPVEEPPLEPQRQPEPEPVPEPPPERTAAEAPRPPEPAPEPVAAPQPLETPAEPSEELPPSEAAVESVEAPVEPAAPAAVSAAAPTAPVDESAAADAMASYIERIQRLIEQHKSYPMMARRRGLEGEVTIELWIDALGSVESISRIGESPKIFWSQTRRAVNSAAPFPAPPDGAVRIVFPLRYDLD